MAETPVRLYLDVVAASYDGALWEIDGMALKIFSVRVCGVLLLEAVLPRLGPACTFADETVA